MTEVNGCTADLGEIKAELILKRVKVPGTEVRLHAHISPQKRTVREIKRAFERFEGVDCFEKLSPLWNHAFERQN